MIDYWTNYVKDRQIEFDQLDRFMRFLSTGKDSIPMKQFIVVSDEGIETLPEMCFGDVWEQLIDYVGSQRDCVAEELQDRKKWLNEKILHTVEEATCKTYRKKGTEEYNTLAKPMTFGAFVNRGRGDTTVHGDFEPDKSGYYVGVPNPPYGVAIVWYPEELFEELYEGKLV